MTKADPQRRGSNTAPYEKTDIHLHRSGSDVVGHVTSRGEIVRKTPCRVTRSTTERQLPVAVFIKTSWKLVLRGLARMTAVSEAGFVDRFQIS